MSKTKQIIKENPATMSQVKSYFESERKKHKIATIKYFEKGIDIFNKRYSEIERTYLLIGATIGWVFTASIIEYFGLVLRLRWLSFIAIFSIGLAIVLMVANVAFRIASKLEKEI